MSPFGVLEQVAENPCQTQESARAAEGYLEVASKKKQEEDRKRGSRRRVHAVGTEGGATRRPEVGAPRTISRQRTRRTSSHIQSDVTQIPKSSRGGGGGAFLPENAPAPACWVPSVDASHVFVFRARTAAFDESASPVSNNFRGSALEVCWRDHSTPIHRLIVCTSGPPIPVRGATRATASICPTSAPLPLGLPGASSQLPRDPQPAVTSTTTCMLQIIRRGRSCDTGSSPASAGGQKAQCWLG